jgi:hypothetical protein
MGLEGLQSLLKKGRYGGPGKCPSTLIARLFQLLSTEWPLQHLPVADYPGFGRGRDGPNSYELKMKDLRQPSTRALCSGLEPFRSRQASHRHSLILKASRAVIHPILHQVGPHKLHHARIVVARRQIMVQGLRNNAVGTSSSYWQVDLH